MTGYQIDDARTPKLTKRALAPAELAALVRAAIADGHHISFNAPGSSMLPFIRSEDKIFVAPVGFDSIRVGDVLVFVQPKSGHVIAHRVVKLQGSRVLCKGDNVPVLFDGWIYSEDILGRVVKVQRHGKPVRLGLGLGKSLIAWLSRKRVLVPLMNIPRQVKRVLSALQM